MTTQELIRFLGKHNVRRDWRNFRCPYHHGEGLHFGVNFISGRYFCWVCLASGTVWKLQQDIAQGKVRKGYDDTVGYKHSYSPIRCKEDSTSPLVIRVSEGTDEKDSDGISPVRKFESGFRSIVDTHPPDKSRLMDAVIEYLVYRNFPIGTLPVGIHDDMLGRVVFPFYNAGILEYYTTRTYTSQYPKTTNPDVEDGWTGKSNVLWLFERLTFTSATYIVEGIFDCGSMWKIGKQAVPVLGKTISTRQMNLLKFAGVNTVVVMLDPDAERESKLMAVNLYDHGFNCHLVNWPMGFSDKDPNSVSLSELREVSENFTAVNRMKALELHFEC